MALDAKSLVRTQSVSPHAFADFAAFSYFVARVDEVVRDFHVEDPVWLLSECEACHTELEAFGYAEDLADGHKRLVKRISMMVGSFPSAAPPMPEVYLQMLIAHVETERPDALTLESTCREIERTSNKHPTTREMLTVLQKHAKLWARRVDVIIDGPDALRKRLQRELAARQLN